MQAFWQILGFLATGGLLTLVFREVLDQIKYKRDLKRTQLVELYGPLCFLVENTRVLFSLNSATLQTYLDLYARKTFAPEAQDAADKHSTQLIDLANSYVPQIYLNRQKMIEIIRDKWHLADEDSQDVFLRFARDFARSEREKPNVAGIHMFNKLGLIPLLTEEFSAHVKAKFEEKKTERWTWRHLRAAAPSAAPAALRQQDSGPQSPQPPQLTT